MWLTRGCERCGMTSADVKCDACGEPMCCDCANMLNCAALDSKGNVYLHMCDDCVTLVNDDHTVYSGPRLVIDNARQGGKA
jgi:hypothetical protein